MNICFAKINLRSLSVLPLLELFKEGSCNCHGRDWLSLERDDKLGVTDKF